MIISICSMGVLVLACLSNGSSLLWNSRVGYLEQFPVGRVQLCEDLYSTYVSGIDCGEDITSTCYCGSEGE